MKIKVRGLVRAAGWIVVVWGSVVTLKGFWDAFCGEPEANQFSPQPWQFITKDQWLRYAGFEICYGMACLGVAYLLWRYAQRLPEWVIRERPSSPLIPS